MSESRNKIIHLDYTSNNEEYLIVTEADIEGGHGLPLESHDI